VSNILYWLFQWVKGELSIPGRLIALFFFICLFMVPLFTVNPYVLRIFILAAIFSIFAASWDLLSGFVGQINLGHALFFGVAAFSSALLIFPDFTGGELGLYGLDRLSDSRILDYFIVILVMICCLLLMWKFTDAKSKIIRTGVIFHAIREDEITARASGINTTRYKLLAYVMSGFFAGIAGGLYAHFMRIAGPSTLDLMITFQGILWTIFGGIVTIYGPVVGVFILYPLLEFANLHPSTANIRFILFALVLIFTTLFMPEGLSTWVLDKIEIKCPRCKVVNFATRRNCRACNAPLHLERGK
jgi:branched-chain amino acid transport system permease protein